MRRLEFLRVAGVGLAACYRLPAVSVATPAGLKAYVESIPNSVVTFEMKGIPGGADGVRPFWMAATEVKWEAFLLWAYAESEATGVLHPTKPYGDVYRGYGRKNQPALGMSHKAAVEYCVWLSRVTGKTYRLPTEAEWLHAYAVGKTRAKDGWHRGNSELKPQPVATTPANALGLYDMAGNVAEWCAASAGERPVVMGGHFAAEAGEQFRLVNNPEVWNAIDPQEPKSVWWLSSVDFTGFRVARSG